jgi:radical SAM protein with 4Fe4S-binding SPASM domain
MASRYELCSFPFSQLFLNPNGKITPCCYLAQDPWYVVGDIQNQTLQEIWNSEKMRALRRELLSGKPKICQQQIQASKCNQIRDDLKQGVSPQEVMPFPMIRLDMMLNGQCNLECVMCGVWTQPNGVFTANGFWETGARDIFPHLKEIDFKGGEPFIQKDFYRLIDEVSAVNADCRWFLTTNGHYRFNDKIKKAMEKINIIRLSVSIDSLQPENFSKIRKKGKLETVLQTLDAFIEQKNHGEGLIEQINANFVVQKANWREVPAFYKFCRDKKIVPFFIVLTNPTEFSMLNLSFEEKMEALNLYLTAMKEDRDRVYLRMIRPILETLKPENQADVFSEHFETLDEVKKYGPSIAEIAQ